MAKVPTVSIRATKRQEFYGIAGNFVTDGIAVFDMLADLHEQFSGRKDKRAILTSTAMRRLRGGDSHDEKEYFTLGQAWDGLIPPIEAMMIDAGEQAADPGGALLRAATMAGNTARIASAIRQESIKPAINLMMLFALLIMISTFVVPTMESFSPRPQWPVIAKLLGSLADHAIFVLAAIIGSIALWTITYFVTRDRWTGTGRRFLDHYVFPWTLHRRLSSALVMKSIASVMRMGVPLSSALEKMGETAGKWANSHFKRINRSMRSGEPEGKALATDLFDYDIRWQIVSYGRLQNFAVGLDRLSDRFTESVIEKTRSLFARIGALVMVTVALIVVWVVGSFLLVAMSARTGI